MRISFIKPQKEIDVAFWQMLFCRIWACLVPVLGVSSVCTILNHALTRCKQNNKILERVRIIADGVNLDFLKEGDIKKEETVLAMRDFLSEILNALAILSGKKVSDEVRNLINKILKQKVLKNNMICLPSPTKDETTCFSFDF